MGRPVGTGWGSEHPLKNNQPRRQVNNFFISPFLDFRVIFYVCWHIKRRRLPFQSGRKTADELSGLLPTGKVTGFPAGQVNDFAAPRSGGRVVPETKHERIPLNRSRGQRQPSFVGMNDSDVFSVGERCFQKCFYQRFGKGRINRKFGGILRYTSSPRRKRSNRKVVSGAGWVLSSVESRRLKR